MFYVFNACENYNSINLFYVKLIINCYSIVTVNKTENWWNLLENSLLRRSELAIELIRILIIIHGIYSIISCWIIRWVFWGEIEKNCKETETFTFFGILSSLNNFVSNILSSLLDTIYKSFQKLVIVSNDVLPNKD